MKLRPSQKTTPRISREIWQEHIEAQVQCRQSVDTYCQQHNLSVSRFHYWKNKLRKEGSLSPFVPVIINPSKPENQLDISMASSSLMPLRFCSIEFGKNSRLVIESTEAMDHVLSLIERKL